METSGARTYRPSWTLIGALAAAAAAWLFVLAVLVTLPGVGGKTYLTVFFFLGFFGVFLVYYGTQSIAVHERGLTVRRLLRLESFDFRDIVRVEVAPGPAVTIYEVFTRRGPIQFSSWFRGHQELLDLIVKEAKLGRA
ncbi:MAG: PH domain-containing protein [Deltaproteobacteria bacterium]